MFCVSKHAFLRFSLQRISGFQARNNWIADELYCDCRLVILLSYFSLLFIKAGGEIERGYEDE